MAKTTAHKKRRASFQIHDDNAAGLSSEQLWNSLNDLLFLAAQPVFTYTDFGVGLCMSLIAASMDKRRKVSIYSANDCRAVLFDAVVFQSGEDILRLLQKIGVERNLIVEPLQDAVDVGKLPGNLLATSPFSEAAMLRHIEQCLQPYYVFRKQIANRYLKLAESLGATNAWTKSQGGLLSDPKEHMNNYMLSALRAIDKFYPHRGTLASYVQQWMNNAAGSRYLVYVGEAYGVPRSHRKTLTAEGQSAFGNFSLPLEEAITVTQDDEQHDTGSENVWQIMTAIYNVPALFPALLQMGCPPFLLPGDVQRISEAPNVTSVPEELDQHQLDRMAALSLAEDINFTHIAGKRKSR